MFKILRKKLTNTRIIALGFIGLILIGAILLTLPISSQSGNATSFLTCLFTATSASCVTGLVVVNTGTYWSLFGKIVILCLIQIGGLGVMTIITMLFLFMRKNISLKERKLLVMSSDMQMSGIKNLVLRIILGTLCFELIGMLVLFICFYEKIGIKRALFFGLFHSVSAFCNAGFDIMGIYNQSSFMSYTGNLLVNITLMILIVIGGIGFIVWKNVLKHGIHFSKYDLHSKIVLSTTAILIIFGAVLFFITEQNASFINLPLGEKITASFFQSITCRTAGFNTIDEALLSNSGALISVFLMLIGGSPGSTAGGVKTTTFAVIIASTLYCARNQESVTMFKKRIHNSAIKQASAIITAYLLLILIATCIICSIDGYSITKVLFEVVSAIGTVGLSMNLTPNLSNASQIVLIILMFAGRIGGLSLILTFAEKHTKIPIDRPTENIMIG